MATWIDELAEVFVTAPLSDPEVRDILRVSREVAHRVERKGTPLAAFLLGTRVAEEMANGMSRASALADAIAQIDRMLPPGVDET